MAFSMFSSSDRPTASISLSPAVVPSESLKIGDTFNLAVQIDDVNGLLQWVFGLSWNPNVLALTGTPVEGPFLKTTGDTLFVAATAPNNVEGRLPEVSSNLLSTNGVNGSGVLATVTFEVVGYGSSAIDFVDVYLRNAHAGAQGEIHFTISGAAFNLPSPFPTPTPTVSPTPTPSITTLPPKQGPHYLKVAGNGGFMAKYASGFSFTENKSKIFLLSAEPRYGYWTQNDTHMDWLEHEAFIHKGDPGFIINVTVRNDYTQSDGWTIVNPDNMTEIGLYVVLHGKNGSIIDAFQAYPSPNDNIFTCYIGETTSFEIFMATNNRQIDSYEILVAIIAAAC
jgi:hypothetical protein